LSFESGFPDISWTGNNVVDFFTPQTFENGNDVIMVQNRSGKPVSCLFINAVSKFLVLDMRPGASLSIKAPKTKGDSHWIAVEGVLGDGTTIPRKHRDFDRRGTRERDCTYLLSIFESASAIEMTGCQ
jgi:hypothetical protein